MPAEENLQHQLVNEMHDFAPWHSQTLGDSGLLRCVQFAMARAECYGFTTRGPIRLYVQMVFLLGASFDTDPLLPWAAEVLSDQTIADQAERSARLYQRLTDFFEHVAGPNNEYAKSALKRTADELCGDLTPGGGDFEAEIFATLRRLYPEKCAYAGDLAVKELIRQGIEAAQRHCTDTKLGANLFCRLMFALGHGFETDPHLPWIQKTLEDSSLTPEKRIERLSSRTKTYLEYVLAHVG